MTETQEHKSMKDGFLAYFTDQGYRVSLEQTVDGHRYDLYGEKGDERFVMECETLAGSRLRAVVPPFKTKLYVGLPSWFRGVEAVLIDNPSKNIKIEIATGQNTLSEALKAPQVSDAQTSSYRISEATGKRFKTTCAALGVSQSAMINLLMTKFNEMFAGQARIDMYAGEATAPPTILQQNIFVGTVDRIEARYSARLLKEAYELYASAEPDSEAHRDFTRRLIDEWRRAVAVQKRTRDPELCKLIEQVEAQIT